MSTPSTPKFSSSAPALQDYTAAIYAARANLEPGADHRHGPGGQLTTTTEVDNWPADVHGVQGPALMQRFLEHARALQDADHLRPYQQGGLQPAPFTLTGDSGQYTSDALIIATGASAKYLGLPSEEAFMGRAYRAAPPATASSTGTRMSAWSAAAIPPWKKPCTCQHRQQRSRWCTGAISSRPNPSWWTT